MERGERERERESERERERVNKSAMKECWGRVVEECWRNALDGWRGERFL